jgi:hypothetical protein
MEAARTSETSVNFYQTTRCYNPEDSHLHTHRRENLKSYKIEMARQLLAESSSIMFHQNRFIQAEAGTGNNCNTGSEYDDNMFIHSRVV